MASSRPPSVPSFLCLAIPFLKLPSPDSTPWFITFLSFSPGKSSRSVTDCHRGNQSDSKRAKENMESQSQSWERLGRSSVRAQAWRQRTLVYFLNSGVKACRWSARSATVHSSRASPPSIILPACREAGISGLRAPAPPPPSQAPHFDGQETGDQRGVWLAVLFQHVPSLRNIGLFAAESWSPNSEE